jgi:hypothetical protein
MLPALAICGFSYAWQSKWSKPEGKQGHVQCEIDSTRSRRLKNEAREHASSALFGVLIQNKPLYLQCEFFAAKQVHVQRPEHDNYIGLDELRDEFNNNVRNDMAFGDK